MLLTPEPPHRSCQGVNMPRKNVLSFILAKVLFMGTGSGISPHHFARQLLPRAAVVPACGAYAGQAGPHTVGMSGGTGRSHNPCWLSLKPNTGTRSHLPGMAQMPTTIPVPCSHKTEVELEVGIRAV
ncbi:hypothetical protein JOQ06_011667 [Pogonophryne albipinna]|uniref:Uncharacterized protein n=1 Tax=Pogonophryne albipinna TaxID=1090488 RepID=A0AAD6BF77_9TELE|nr:hypothetical protein JOQ06_011667 [Pogonophryne albipinna]